MVRLAPQRVSRVALLDTGYLPRAAGAAGEEEAAKRHALLKVAQEQGVRAMAQVWVQGMVPVSYTHLDVYKRQLQGRAVGAVRDMIQLRKEDRVPGDFVPFKLPFAKYFNSGVLLIDTQAWNCLLYTSRCV